MKILTGKLFKEMVLCGANTLHNNHPEIDALNVFIYEIAKKLSKGLLMGARGNSGVILSQIFRGFAMGLEGHEQVDAVAFANAWANGAKVAYKAVMRPVEGTILTVIREASEKVVEYAKADMEIEDVFSYFVKEAENSLASKAELFIGGHGGAAQRDAVEFKIAYLNKMKEVFEDNRTAQTFVNAMKEAFPGLPGETGLEELGKALYK